jgi:hypothetical protein
MVIQKMIRFNHSIYYTSQDGEANCLYGVVIRAARPGGQSGWRPFPAGGVRVYAAFRAWGGRAN